MRNPNTFVKYSAFLRKVVHNFQANNYEVDLASSNLSRIARNNLPPCVVMKWEEFCNLHGIEYAIFIDFSDRLKNYAKACENLVSA